jgi:3-deoxy-7-phosphoheptulonate synthase
VEELRKSLIAASRGGVFVLQGGDCVERFTDCQPERIADRLRILLQMSVVLTHAARTPVLRIGRIAGQFFKPRSTETEEINGERVLTYRGDPVHAFAPADPSQSYGAAREPDPERLQQGYFHAASTLNYIRAMIAGGFADLHHPDAWNLAAMHHTPQWQEYRTIVDRILDAIHFMESFGGVNEQSVGNISFYTSHEALHLPWETALTRCDGESGLRYNLAAHTVWLGARTGDPDGPHAAYLASIANPLGVKVGPTATADWIRRLLERLDPDRAPGRIMLISRMGAGHVERALPPLIEAVRNAGHPVIWMVDPMHGNTITTTGGVKTRRVDRILAEIEETFAVHRATGSRVGGVHFELTGDDVTECVGGALELTERDLSRNYESWCDPRLNYTQAMEMAFKLSHLLRPTEES